MNEYTQDTARDDDDRLPWLEAADVDEGDDRIAPGKLVALVLAALIALGIVIGGVWYLRSTNAPPAKDPTLIAAQEGDYKVRPDNPGGMKVEGKGDRAFATSEGAEANGRIDPAASPETPVQRSPAKVTTRPAPVTKAAPTTQVTLGSPAGPLEAAPPLAASGGAGTQMVQLGAYGSEAKANIAWVSLGKRFAFLAALPKQVVAASVGGTTVYRLRVAAGGQASAICAKLRAAGENCLLVR